MSEVSNFVKTRDEVTDLLSVIDSISENLFKVNKTIDVPQKYEELFAQSGIDLSVLEGKVSPKRNEFEDELLKLREEVAALKPVSVTLAFEPTSEFIDRLTGWFSGSGFKDIMLDISVEPLIVGGIVLDYGGFHTDLSLASTLDSYLQGLDAAKLESLISHG